jgi:uncharacterized damage-inducible protein DinB
MQIGLSFDDFTAYTGWEREKWRCWFKEHGDEPLRISAGPHGDGRFETIGDVVRHIFGAEKRYVERLSGLPLTDLATIPNDSAETLFQFAHTSRKELKEFVGKFAAGEWDVEQELKFPNLNMVARATPKKIVLHVLMHEIRHWAQIATMLRLNGLVDQWHDLIVSPVMGGGFSRSQT